MPAPPKLKDASRVLIVEGYSDLLFYAEVLEVIGKNGAIFIKHFNGKEDLTTKLETFIDSELLAEKTHIGVIVDANGNAGGAFASLQKVLAECTTQTVQTVGTWTSGQPRIGLFIAPDGVGSGEIETLVWRSWSTDPGNDKAKICIEEFADCMKSAGHKAQSPDKGLIGSLLAIRNDDDPRLGPGARSKVFDFNRPEFEPLRAFLSGF